MSSILVLICGAGREALGSDVVAIVATTEAISEMQMEYHCHVRVC